MSESFAELFEESLANVQMQPGALIQGTVVDIRNDMVIVSAGLKSEGVIPLAQFADMKGNVQVNVGDIVEVALDSVEDGFGETRLSREKAKRARSWTALEEAHSEGKVIEGLITSKVKGGFTVEINEVRAFLPGSLVDVRPVRDTSYLEGKCLEFKVIKMDRKRNNVVVSRRAVVETMYSEEREELISSLKEGLVTKGVVKNLTDYGAFLDLGGIDGLLHITDMAWKRVNHPSEVVAVGDEVEVVVLKFDKEKNRVSLGLKQLGDDPWSDITRRYPEGTRLFGKITNIADYGCFVEVEEGIEGLVHVSEMDWTNKNINPNKVVALGDEVEVMILDIDGERRRISLGMKQCHANPWEAFAATHNKGDKVKGVIKSITDFGIFIGLDGGIDGFLHLSDLSWEESGEEAVRGYKKGDELEAVVLAVDSERERISLGVKQMEDDPFSQFIVANPKGSVVTGQVIDVDAKGVRLEIVEGVEGYIKVSELAKEHVEDASKVFSVGDRVEAKFIGVDRKNRSIILSVKEKDSDEEAATIAEYQSDGKNSGATLGDILREQIKETKR